MKWTRRDYIGFGTCWVIVGVDHDVFVGGVVRGVVRRKAKSFSPPASLKTLKKAAKEFTN